MWKIIATCRVGVHFNFKDIFSCIFTRPLVCICHKCFSLVYWRLPAKIFVSGYFRDPLAAAENTHFVFFILQFLWILTNFQNSLSIDFQGNSLCICNRDFHLTLTMLLHYLVNMKIQNNCPTLVLIPKINLFYTKLIKS